MKKNKIKFKNEKFFIKPKMTLTQEQKIKKVKANCVKRYRQKTIKSGNVVEIEIHPIWNTNVIHRGKKFTRTTDEQEKVNARNRRKHLARILRCNFGEGDLWMTFGHRNGENPKDCKEAKKYITNYFTTLRRESKKIDHDLKYIYVIEKSANGRYHYHIICNFPDRDIAESKWKWGKYPQSRRIQESDGGIDGLASYITKEIKEEKNMRNYGWSKGNLKQPSITISDTAITKRKAERFIKSEYEIIEYTEKKHPGMRCIDTRIRFSDYVDGAYISAKLIKRE